MKVQFYPLDITYTIKNDNAIILLFGRTTNNKAVCIADEEFRPYFYIMLKRGESLDQFKDRINGLEKQEGESEENLRIYKILSAEIVRKKYFGNEHEIIKVCVNVPSAVRVFSEIIQNRIEVEKILENDISFTKRYLAEKQIIPFTLHEAEGEETAIKAKEIKADLALGLKSIRQAGNDHLPNPRVLAFDIETYSPRDAARINKEEFPILMVSFYADDGRFKKVITWKRFKTEPEEDYIEFVNSEADLIARFRDVIVKYKPEIITGYFSDSFDLPYIKTRAAKYKVELDFGLDGSGLVEIRKADTTAAYIAGINHVDVFRFVKFFLGEALATKRFDLNSVAKELIGEEKNAGVDIKELADVWDNANTPKNAEKLMGFCRYNLQDSMLAYKIFDYIYPSLIELAKMTGLALFETCRMSCSEFAERFLIRQSFIENELVPPKPTNEEKAERSRSTFKGGFVFEPKPGLYNEIVVFDFRSLYPTIIASHNISPETVNAVCNDEEKDYAPSEETDGSIWFCKSKAGFMPKVIKDIISRRTRVNEILKAKKEGHQKRDPLLEARSNTLKILANSFYGYLGYYLSRWHSMKCVNAVTAWGRHYIKQVIEKAAQQNFDVLYSDTDSIFLSLKDKTKEDALKFMEIINIELPELMELELQGFYKRGIFVPAKSTAATSAAGAAGAGGAGAAGSGSAGVTAGGGSVGAKKRYALVDENDQIIVTGFETVRKNWSSIAKKTQEKLFKIILLEKDIKSAKNFVLDVVEMIENKKVPNDELIITTQLSKEVKDYEQMMPHVMAAKRMEREGIPAGPGTMVSYIIKEGNEMINERARLPHEIEEGGYDGEYYIFNQIIPAVESIFNVLGVNILEVIEQKDQSRLDSFI